MIYEASKTEMSTQRFDSPIHISYDRLVSSYGNQTPEWLKTYLKKNDLVDQSYEDWISLYHKDFARPGRDFSKDKFTEARNQFGEEFGDEKASLLYAATFNTGGVRYAYILFRRGEFYNSVEEAIEAGRLSSASLVDEGKGWKMYRLSSAPLWFRKITMVSIDLFDGLGERGSLVIESENAAPSYFLELETYGFFKELGHR